MFVWIFCACYWTTRTPWPRTLSGHSPFGNLAEVAVLTGCWGADIGFSLEISRWTRFSRLKFLKTRAMRAPMIKKSAYTTNKVHSKIWTTIKKVPNSIMARTKLAVTPNGRKTVLLYLLTSQIFIEVAMMRDNVTKVVQNISSALRCWARKRKWYYSMWYQWLVAKSGLWLEENGKW